MKTERPHIVIDRHNATRKSERKLPTNIAPETTKFIGKTYSEFILYLRSPLYQRAREIVAEMRRDGDKCKCGYTGEMTRGELDGHDIPLCPKCGTYPYKTLLDFSAGDREVCNIFKKQRDKFVGRMDAVMESNNIDVEALLSEGSAGIKR